MQEQKVQYINTYVSHWAEIPNTK